jgi:hypothetical protein
MLSDCYMHDKKSVKNCLVGDPEKVKREGAEADGVPEKCRQIQHAHTICIRGLVRARVLFRDCLRSLTSEIALSASRATKAHKVKRKRTADSSAQMMKNPPG